MYEIGGEMNKKDLLKKLLFTCAYFLLIFVFYKMEIGCIFLRFLHIPCPGCGMTRAWLSALSLDFASAFRHHFMFWSAPLLYLWFLFDGKLFKNRKINKAAFILIALGFAANWFYQIYFYLSY